MMHPGKKYGNSKILHNINPLNITIMNSKIQVKVEELNALAPVDIVENRMVEQKFIQMYNAIHGTASGINFYEKEKFNFQKLLQEKPDLATCTKLSIFGAFLDVAVNGLSLDTAGKPHCYLIPRNVKTGYKDANGRPVYEKRVSVSVTGYGELVMRMRAGQIKYIDNPVVVYEGDTFGAELASGKKVVSYKAAIPRKSDKIIGCFIRIVRNDGTDDYQWMLQDDVKRLAAYSSRNNSYYDQATRQFVAGKANELYSSNGGQIDPGFLENKMIKHAFDAYPKVKTGKFTQFETQEPENGQIDYGIEEAECEELKPAAFGSEGQPPAELPAVTVQTTEEDEYAGF